MEPINKIVKINKWLDQPDAAGRERIERNIQEQAKATASYFVLLTIAGAIITIGLLIDSNAAIIGGMLIAPLFWPIVALALAIMEGKKVLLGDSLFTLFRSFIILFTLGIIGGMLSPSSQFGTEIITRTQPTIYELLIAIISGLGGAFTLIYSKQSASALFGVAMAVALVPPVCTAGILFGVQDIEGGFGATLLFATNLLAIIITASFMFLVAKISRATKTGEKRRRIALTWTLTSFFLVLIPIILLSWTSIQNTYYKEIIVSTATIVLPDARFEKIQITSNRYDVTVSANVFAKGGLSQAQLEDLGQRLRDYFDKRIDLNLNVIPTLDRNASIN